MRKSFCHPLSHCISITVMGLIFLFIVPSDCSQKTKKTQKQISLILWHTFNREETTTLNKIILHVSRTEKDLRIQSTVIPFTRAQNEFRKAVKICSPGAPDLFRAELPWIAEFVEKGLMLLPLILQSPLQTPILLSKLNLIHLPSLLQLQ